MGVFENFFVKGKAVFEVMGAKAGRFIDVSKLRIDIADLESKKKMKFEKLGVLAYRAKKDGVMDEDTADSLVHEIEEFIEKTKRLNHEIDRIKNKVPCECCDDKKNGKEFSSYCSKCGKELVKCCDKLVDKSEKSLNNLKENFQNNRENDQKEENEVKRGKAEISDSEDSEN